MSKKKKKLDGRGEERGEGSGREWDIMWELNMIIEIRFFVAEIVYSWCKLL